MGVLSVRGGRWDLGGKGRGVSPMILLSLGGVAACIGRPLCPLTESMAIRGLGDAWAPSQARAVRMSAEMDPLVTKRHSTNAIQHSLFVYSSCG